MPDESLGVDIFYKVLCSEREVAGTFCAVASVIEPKTAKTMSALHGYRDSDAPCSERKSRVALAIRLSCSSIPLRSP